uniref:Sodium/calcium exchanger membrane region domain-containing protein n=1 Tax=Aplanochytrium stocchinoi TaxID=215587 RepID=A0A7S3PG68_9STRA
MGETLGKLFVPLSSLPGLYEYPAECKEPVFNPEDHLKPTFGGIVQLLFLACVYGCILFYASNLISDGSELLLLIPSIAPIVGSVVLPILGAVPDGAIVLFSGLGPNAQDQLTVGVGALAGSTIMLLTIPWALSIWAGRVNINSKGQCTYRKPASAPDKWRKLSKNRTRHDMLNRTGVEPNYEAMSSGALTMILTAIPYLIIQGAAFEFEGDSEEKIASEEKYYALVGLIFCTIAFFSYLYIQVRNSRTNQVLEDVVDSKRMDALKHGLLSLQGIFYNSLNGEVLANGGDPSAQNLLGFEHKKNSL